jgi:flagellar hook-associated protein 2
MSRISSSVGLITGIPIEETVAKLMAVAARPRDILKSRNDGLKQQQLAIDTLGSRLLSFQFAVNKLKATSVFQTREVTSSDTDVLDVALPATGTPTVGSFQVRPVQAASAQQLVSQRFESAAEELSGGLLSFRFGGHVDKGVALDQLNGGAGVPRGKIRITDRSGATATIDLSFARTVDDVLAAINSNSDISVTAATSGDALTLTDNSGGSGNLRVQEVGSGTTAAGLGLAGINVAASQAAGGDVLTLHANTKLSELNDGNGVEITEEGVVDLFVTLSDASELSIDLHDAVTLGDVVEQINAADPDKLVAAISADGRRLELTDLTGGVGDFSVANGAASTAAQELGIAAEVSGSATITGGRLIAGLRDTLLASLNGGQGLGDLGDVEITDRDGGSDTVDLSGAETLGDVVELINASSAAVSASINAARNGIVVADESGGSGDLTIANADATNSADALGIAVDDAVASVNSGALGRQTLSRATLLSSLNGGKGVTLGDVRVTDTDGVSQTADLDAFGSAPTTVGDVIDAINALTNGVEARINDTGDGILIVDTAEGSSPLAVKDVSGNLAKSLNLTRPSTTVEIEGTPTKVIDGTAAYAIDLDNLEFDSSAISLESLNGGSGVAAGDFVITDSQGRSIAIDLNGADAGVTTVGELIDLINAKGAVAASGFGVEARINDAGSGILLEDTAGGSGQLTVTDVNSTTAADLKLTGVVITSGSTQTINGAGTFAASSAAETGLNALAARINELNAGVTASAIFDGVGYRLSLSVDAAGSANELLVDAGLTGFEFEETSKAQDALLLFGNLTNPGAGVLLSSPDGEFAGAVGGVDVTVKAASETPVTINVRQTNASLVEAVEDLVDSYNALRTDLGKLTAFDAEAVAVGLLFGTNEALQIDSRLSLALTARYTGLGDLQSLEQIGLSVADDGTLELDASKLEAAFEDDPDGVEEFLTNSQNGVAVKISAIVDRLAGAEDSLLAARSDALQASIAANDDRLTKFEESLERQQERMFLQFYQLEAIIAKMQTSLTAIQNLQVLPPLTSSRT